MRRKKVALVLSSGGARGYAHIGAIEELEEQGYEITSVAGASMGALVGGVYAAGKLPELKERMLALGMREIFSLVDMSLSLNHVVKGDKVMEELKQMVQDVRIEDLPVPFCAVATDIKNREEVVIETGSLYEAIRASISIPSFFRPMKDAERVLIDGGVVNPLPLNRVQRTEGDLLAAVNVSAPSSQEIEGIRSQAYQLSRRKGGNLAMLKRMMPARPSVESNYFSLLSKTFSLMIEQNTALALQITPPDLLVNIPMNRFGGFDYDRADKIIRFGKNKMREAINDWRSFEHELGFQKT
ncbi:MAG: patatin-like phospholipase family protein [Bacteroides sp.]|nr:patatin-like phospholipase family protein [Bacteroides sp.]